MSHQTPNEMLKEKSRSLIEVYLDLQRYYEKEYGKHALVIMEVGSFFEVYGVDNDEMTVGKPKEIAELLNIQLTRKNKRIAENSVKNPLMAGWPTATFDRYMSRIIQEKKYTVIVVRQKGDPPKVERYIDSVLSPGVNIDYQLDHEDNFILSLLVEESRGVYSAGYAAIDVSTGKSYIAEFHSSREDKTLALDELFQRIQTQRSHELVLTLGNAVDAAFVLNYLGLEGNDGVKLLEKRHKIAYQNELLKQCFHVESFLTPIELFNLEKAPLTSEALSILLDFIIGHDEQVIQKLTAPTRIEGGHFLYLGNNPLEQLNILSRHPDELTVARLIDKTVTSIGRRLLHARLSAPILREDVLRARYDLVDALAPLQHELDIFLRNIYDIERIARRTALGRLHPFELNFLYDSFQAAREIITLFEAKQIALLPDFVALAHPIQTALSYMEETLNLDECVKVNRGDIQTSLFQRGVDTALDALLDKEAAAQAKLNAIRQKIVELIHDVSGNEEEKYVLIKQLDKEGHHITVTKSRFTLIEDTFKKQFISLDGTVYAFGDFKLRMLTSLVKITAPIIDEISAEIVVLQRQIAGLSRQLFARELAHLDREWHATFDELVKSLAAIDVALSTAKAATAYRLTRPEIVSVKDDVESFLEIEALRHPLVEVREENGIYVPNDVLIGSKAQLDERLSEHVLYEANEEKNTRGVLLYGINSSGKSSLMKSIGIAVILAQAGYFVPAKAMRFSVFKELFTRILARDDFEKGLSSFAVEMMELKNIFNRASARSLILGDEISRGTETLSAVAIVSATISRLIELKPLFVFTTHLHQLGQVVPIDGADHFARVHLSVHYDEANDCLVFDRKLHRGSGSRIYGLEFAQSLHMDEAFLKRAMTIRKSLANEFTQLERLTHQQQSPYNKEMYVTVCVICDKHVEDVHHIAPQQIADADGNIEHFHKDHKYNLVPLCKDCHHKVHHGELEIEGFVMTEKGIVLKMVEED